MNLFSSIVTRMGEPAFTAVRGGTALLVILTAPFLHSRLCRSLRGLVSSVMSRAAILILGTVTSVMLPGCDEAPTDPGETGALRISSVEPAPDAGHVEVGATISITFSEAVDPTTVDPGTVELRKDGLKRPTAVRYDPETRTATVVGPLLPGAMYEVDISEAVTTPDGEALEPQEPWRFTTRSWEPFSLEEGGLGGSLSVGPDGRRHVAFRREGDVVYATCGVDCDRSAGWESAILETGLYRAGVVLDQNPDTGDLHVAYLYYHATCGSDCLEPAQWNRGNVYSTVGGQPSTLAVDGEGRIHGLRRDRSRNLLYVSCASACTESSSWSSEAIVTTGTAGAPLSMAVEAGGRIHATYFDEVARDLEYATCAADCSSATSWETTTVDRNGDVGYESSVVVDAGGRLHVTYYDHGLERLKYATCSETCHLADRWRTSGADHHPSVGRKSSLTVDGHGRLHVVHQSMRDGGLRYATCARRCEAGPENWEAIPVPPTGTVVTSPRIVVDGNGRVGILFTETTTPEYDGGPTTRNLKYVE